MSRINSEIQKAIAEIVSNKMNNPDFDGLIISIIDVDTAADLSIAKVAVSVLSTDEMQRLIILELTKAKGFIRKELGKMIRLKTLPDLEFYPDNSYQQGKRLMDLIDSVSKEVKDD